MAISDLDFPVGVVARSHSDSAQLAQALAENVAGALRDAIDSHGKATLVAVSYTHLTLPTIYSV
mgnify:CR=1 FL=1